jgi:signal transduction histidine kinase
VDLPGRIPLAMSITSPALRHPSPSSQDPRGNAAPGSETAERITARLAQVEAELTRLAGGDTAGLRDAFAELRALLAQQASTQASVEERTRELASLSNFLQTHSEREKALLARELHDALGGILTPAKMDLAWLESRLGDHPEYGARLRRLGTLIDNGIDLKRRIIENLRPSLLDHLGLASALHWYVEEACRSATIESRLMISERLERLPADLEIALYRLVQESVNNIVKHAHAKTLELTLERTEEGLKLGIADDGVGIADLEYAKRLSHGLAGMMHRVRSVNGSFDVHSQLGKGTRIDVFVPLKKQP